jgi:hypothetical protein
VLRDEGELHVDSFAKYAAAFLRNSHRHYLDLGWLENVSERFRTSLEISEDTPPIALFVIGRAGICVVHPMANSMSEQPNSDRKQRINKMKSAEFAGADAGGIFERKASYPERSGSIHHLGAA